jgi:hypothetical protein
VRPAAVVVGDELVAEGLQLSDRGGLPRLRSEPLFQRLLEPFHFAAGGGVARLGVLLDHTQMAEFSITPRWRSSAWKPFMVSRPARPPAKRVVNTMPLSDSTEAGMPCSAIACRNTATTAGPVTGWWQVTERA